MENSILKDRIFWLLLIFASMYILGNIGTGSLTTWDETCYAIVARDILRSNDWIALRLNGQPWFDKPPLYMWMTAVSYRLFGINEFSARLTSALFGVMGVMLIYSFGSHISNKKTGLLSALILLATPHYIHFAKTATIDVMLTFFIILSIYLFIKAEEDDRYLFLSALSIGLGYLAKGFASFLGVFIILIYAVLVGRWRHLFNRHFILGAVLSSLIIASWHISQYLVFGKESIDGYFGTHTFGRVTKAMDFHTGGINFYQKAIFNKNKPWSILMYISAFYVLWQALRNRDKNAILICCWIVVTYGLYTIVSTKLHWYIMPIYPVLVLATGLFLERIVRGKAFAVLLVIICLGLLLQMPYSWAFKLDFSPDVKSVSQYIRSLSNEGKPIYFYGGYDNKHVFYLGDYVKFLSDKDKPIKNSYCVIREADLPLAESLYKIRLKPIKYFGDIVITNVSK